MVSYPMKESALEKRGTKQARLVDVALQAGVSTSVAGSVLNKAGGNSRASVETIERVRKIAAEMGYRPNPGARQLRGTRTFTYGIMVASSGDPLRAFIVEGLDAEARKVDRNIMMCNTFDDFDRGKSRFNEAIGSLSRYGVDGVFCVVHARNPGDRTELLRVHPNTVFYENPGIAGAAYVEPDRTEIMSLSVRHLATRGRKRIGLAVETLATRTGELRLAGYTSELEANGLQVCPELIFDGSLHGWGNGSRSANNETWLFPMDVAEFSVEQLVTRGKADAIVVHHDYWAALIIRLLRQRGLRVPEDVAVIGYLNHGLTEYTDPPLTSISPNYRESTGIMVAMLEKMIVNGSLPENEREVLIAPSLVPRQST